MPDLYLDVICPACGGCHDLFDHDSDTLAGGSAYWYDCPVRSQRVDIRLRFPDAPAAATPAGAVGLHRLPDCR